MTQAKTAPEGKEKAKQGTSTAARAKALILTLAASIPEGLVKINNTLTDGDTPYTMGEFFDDESLATEFNALAAEFRAGTQRGLPLATKLENIQTEIATHWQNAPVKDGRLVADYQWARMSQILLNRRDAIEKAIASAKEAAAANKDSEANQPSE